MIAYWLDRLQYFGRMMECVADQPGDIVECGVGAGRSLSMLAYWMRQPPHAARHLFAFDSFQGFPEPVAQDASDRRARRGEWSGTSPERIRGFLEASGVNRDFLDTRLHFIPGFFSDTLPSWPPRPIALLHLDVDLYESYQQTLTGLFPLVVDGGLILFDGYDDPQWPGARLAIDAYFKDSPSVIQKDKGIGKCFVVKHRESAVASR